MPYSDPDRQAEAQRASYIRNRDQIRMALVVRRARNAQASDALKCLIIECAGRLHRTIICIHCRKAVTVADVRSSNVVWHHHPPRHAVPGRVPIAALRRQPHKLSREIFATLPMHASCHAGHEQLTREAASVMQLVQNHMSKLIADRILSNHGVDLGRVRQKANGPVQKERPRSKGA